MTSFSHTDLDKNYDDTHDTETEFSEDDLVQLALLRTQEIDELVDANLINSSSRFDDSLLAEIVLNEPEVIITVRTGTYYPAVQLDIEFDNVSLPRLTMDSLRIECRRIILEGSNQNNSTLWKQREEDGLFNFHMTALELFHCVEGRIKSYRELLQNMKSTMAVVAKPITGISHFSPTGLKNNNVSEKGIDLSSLAVDYTASSILNKLPDEICAMIPEQFRVLHVESVLRNDLYHKFKDCQERMYNLLATQPRNLLKKCVPPGQLEGHDRDTQASMAKYLTTPKMTFHGTSNRFVPSIVRNGFLAPGTKHPETHQPLPVRCGSTYGQGIYSSPSAEFSLSYSGSEARPTTTTGFWGLKLFVCATIMGRPAQMTRADDWMLRSKPFENADSHVGNNNMEYIVFDNAQILPCYVIHLDWGKDNEKYFEDVAMDRAAFIARAPRQHPKLSREDIAPGDRQRMKEGLVAKAAKYFPYGYGPATGTRFVVEEVGEVDEDEEEYGDYQSLRIDDNDAGKDFWDWEEEDTKQQKVEPMSKFDEYTKFKFGNAFSGMEKFRR